MTEKSPIMVLLNEMRQAPLFNFFPKSLTSERMYVPLLHFTSKSTFGKLV